MCLSNVAQKYSYLINLRQYLSLFGFNVDNENQQVKEIFNMH